MNILFLTLLDFSSFSDRNIYCDLLREFIRNGHDVYCVSPTERRYDIPTHLEEENHLLKLKIGNTQKTNLFEKGISTIRIETQFINAIKEHFSHIKFDLVLYSTPPITLCKAVDFVKKRDNAKSYLLLKDIFPQNAVDLGLMKKHGLKGFIYNYFRRKEKKLYAVSDYIGCMSEANVRYLLRHNHSVDTECVQIAPNSIEVQDLRLSSEKRKEMRKLYGIPADKKVFVYGGNLGKPQGIPFIIDCIRMAKEVPEAYFLIVGEGTEYDKLVKFVKSENPSNLKLMKVLPKEYYDSMIAACDVGMIFLDNRFSIPNFPSRLLSYMQASIPVLACTDSNTDIGDVISKGGFGWSMASESPSEFIKLLKSVLSEDLVTMGDRGFDFLNKNYSVQVVYKVIMSNFI